MEARLNSVPTKPLNPGDKVLLYRPVSAEAKRNKLPWLEGYTVVKSNNMVIKIRNNDNVTCWVHRTQLRYVPDRPENLQQSTPLMIPLPIITTQLSQPPTGGRPIQQGGSSENRRSKIPVLSESAKNRRNSTIPVSKEIIRNEDTDAISKPTVRSTVQTSQPLRRRQPSNPSVNSSQQSVSRTRPRQAGSTTRRYPERLRKPPVRHKDFVKH